MRGHGAEELAAQYLQGQCGYRVIAQNYRCLGGEIDLIAYDGSTLVFVEVKMRTRGTAMDAWESVDWKKRSRIRAAASHFLAHRPIAESSEVRFDVLLISQRGAEVEFQLLQDAFREE